MKLLQLQLELRLSCADKEFLTELQQQLSILNYYPKNEIDGEYGPKTQEAWGKFKAKNHQAKPDFIGPGSISLLLEATNTKPLPSEDLAHKIVNYCKKQDYRLDTRPTAINIIGLEGFKVEDVPDKWNDAVCLLTFDKNKSPLVIAAYVATTEPGAYYTINPLNKNGAARLQLCQHKNLWRFGTHRGYRALVQVGTATLVRDKNKNYKRDDKITLETGNGVNLHTTKTTGWRGSAGDSIGQWSAGCVVIKNPDSFLTLIQRLENCLQYKLDKNTTFDFTLIDYNRL